MTIREYTLADAVHDAYVAVENGLSRADGEVASVSGIGGKVVCYRVGSVIRIDVRRGKMASSDDPKDSQV